MRAGRLIGEREMLDRGQVTDIERRCERLEAMVSSPLVLAGALVDTLRSAAATQPQLTHPAKLAAVLLEILRTSLAA